MTRITRHTKIAICYPEDEWPDFKPAGDLLLEIAGYHYDAVHFGYTFVNNRTVRLADDCPNGDGYLGHAQVLKAGATLSLEKFLLQIIEDLGWDAQVACPVS